MLQGFVLLQHLEKAGLPFGFVQKNSLIRKHVILILDAAINKSKNANVNSQVLETL